MMMIKTQQLIISLLGSSKLTGKNQFYKLPWLQYLGGRCLSTAQKTLPVIYMFTKENCSLCVAAKAVLEPYRHRFTLKEVDITRPENKEWFEKYQYDIPVFHVEDDFLFKHKVDLTVLEKVLKNYEDK